MSVRENQKELVAFQLAVTITRQQVNKLNIAIIFSMQSLLTACRVQAVCKTPFSISLLRTQQRSQFDTLSPFKTTCIQCSIQSREMDVFYTSYYAEG